MYIVENKINSAIEAEGSKMATEVAKLPVPEEVILAVEPEPPDRNIIISRSVNEQRLDYIYDDEPLGFEKDPMAPEKMHPQDPLKEINLGAEGDKRPTFISANIDPKLRPEGFGQIKVTNQSWQEASKTNTSTVCTCSHVEDQGGSRKTPPKQVQQNSKVCRMVGQYCASH